MYLVYVCYKIQTELMPILFALNVINYIETTNDSFRTFSLNRISQLVRYQLITF